MSTILAPTRVTVSTAERRVDVVVPDHLALAHVMPDLLRYAGLATVDPPTEGWVLRRTDGQVLDVALSLAAQDVPDGAVLHLAPAEPPWPGWSYDDVVESIAAHVRHRGAVWGPASTRLLGLLTGGLALTVALAALLVTGLRAPAETAAKAGHAGPAVNAGHAVNAGPASNAGPAVPAGPAVTVRAAGPFPVPAVAWLALVAAVVLAGSAVLASRVQRDPAYAATLTGAALTYATVTGVVAPGPGTPPAARLAAGAAALLFGVLVTWPAVPLRGWAPAAGTVLATLALAGGLLCGVLPTRSVAAVLITAAVLLAGAAPPLAVRLGRIPLPTTLARPGPQSEESAGPASGTGPVTSGAPGGAARAPSFAEADQPGGEATGVTAGSSVVTGAVAPPGPTTAAGPTTTAGPTTIAGATGPTRGADIPAGRGGPVSGRCGAAVVPVAAARADDILAGLLVAASVATAGASVLLMMGFGTGSPGVGPVDGMLVAVAAMILLVRARLYPAVRHRVPLLAGGVAALAVLAAAALVTAGPAVRGPAVALVLIVSALAALSAGRRYSARVPSPRLGRLADLLEAGGVVTVIPLACGVLGWYAVAATVFR